MSSSARTRFAFAYLPVNATGEYEATRFPDSLNYPAIVSTRSRLAKRASVVSQTRVDSFARCRRDLSSQFPRKLLCYARHGSANAQSLKRSKDTSWNSLGSRFTVSRPRHRVFGNVSVSIAFLYAILDNVCVSSRREALSSSSDWFEFDRFRR